MSLIACYRQLLDWLYAVPAEALFLAVSRSVSRVPRGPAADSPAAAAEESADWSFTTKSGRSFLEQVSQSQTAQLAEPFSLFGCAQKQKEFDREEAAKAIANSEKFKDCHTGMNNRDACNWNIYAGRWETVASYWGSSKDHPPPNSLRANPLGYWLYREKGYLQVSSSPEILSLSDAGRTASKDWTLVALPGKEVPGALERWEVPLAAKKLVAITNVLREQRMGIQVAQVTYSWVYSLIVGSIL